MFLNYIYRYVPPSLSPFMILPFFFGQHWHILCFFSVCPHLYLYVEVCLCTFANQTLLFLDDKPITYDHLYIFIRAFLLGFLRDCNCPLCELYQGWRTV
jgi:hypothetical protein